MEDGAGVKAFPDEIDIQGILDADSGFRVELSHGMRAPIINGQPTLRSCVRADCYTKVNKRWQPLITLVDDTFKGVLTQLAALSEEGKVKITR